ncbi:MAG: OsmC family protein [candidate division Zixibacteria bacterium]|nr:OsmC family protein [candidate division Zixibacteria bacterium]
MEAKVKWTGKRSFLGETESRHKVKMDIAIEKGGENSGPPPIQLALVALGACTGIDVVSILEKKRAKLEGMEIKLEAEQAENYPKVFRKINLEFIFQGKDLKEADLKNAIELSKNKYCSIGAMLEKTAVIDYTWTIKTEESLTQT